MRSNFTKQFEAATSLEELLNIYYEEDVDADEVIKHAYALGFKDGNRIRLESKETA